jgi:AAA+ ATPase superfamily predicted ATPase
VYFSLEVKTKKEEFFNMESELETLKKEILDQNTRMIVIKGLRRTGKSSLMRVALNETKVPHIFIDLRLSTPFTPENFYQYFSKELEKFLKEKTLKKILSKIKGIEISGLKLKFKERKINIIAEILEEIGKWSENKQVVLAIDEAQDLRYMKGFDKILAHVYDYVKGIKILIAGSEVGLLDKVLGIGNPKAPLFGRAFVEINLKKLSKEKSIEFLKIGFEQAGIKVDEEEINKAVSILDGIIGWLTFYGYLRTRGYGDALERAINEGAKLIANEFKQFLEIRQIARRRYIEIMKTLIRPLRWSEVKRSLRIISNVSDKQISNYLKELMYYGFIEKRDDLYSISDPLLIEAIRRGYIQ